MARTIDPDSRKRVLDAADKLFHQRGFSAVSMSDIARALEMRKASLYHHAPGGKEELYVAVMQRKMAAHKQGLDKAIGSAGTALSDQLMAAADWFIGHAPLGVLAMLETDMPAISAENSQQVRGAAYMSLWMPIRTCFYVAQQQERIRSSHPDVLAGIFLSIMEGLTYSGSNGELPDSMHDHSAEAIDILLNGINIAD